VKLTEVQTRQQSSQNNAVKITLSDDIYVLTTLSLCKSNNSAHGPERNLTLHNPKTYICLLFCDFCQV